jgi:hypothetical protein
MNFRILCGKQVKPLLESIANFGLILLIHVASIPAPLYTSAAAD